MSLPFDPKIANDVSRKYGKLLGEFAKDPSMREPQIKGDGSPVTPADLEISARVIEALKPLGFLVISEEALPASPPGPQDSYFLVDPLDGTKYFARGEDEFALCIGFIHQGQPAYGAIYDPTGGVLYWAVRGQGAYKEETPISHGGVSQGDKLRVYSSGFHKRPEKSIFVDELGIGEIREKGSALKFCDIAQGEVDLYMRFGPTSEWDTAAAQVILEEAGCVLYEVKTLSPMTYGKANYFNRGVIACQQDLIAGVVNFVEKYQIQLKNSRRPNHGQ